MYLYGEIDDIKLSFLQRPSTELVRAVNKFKADFGGQVVSLERVQPSADHVPHRFLSLNIVSIRPLSNCIHCLSAFLLICDVKYTFFLTSYINTDFV